MPGGAGQEARGSGEAQPQAFPDILNIPVDSWVFQTKLIKNLGQIVYESGPRGEYAGYGSICTELWEASDRPHRFKCTFVLLGQDDIKQDANRYEPECSGTLAIWNTTGITGKYGKAFRNKYLRARALNDLPRTQGDPPVQSFVNFFANHCDATGQPVSEKFGDPIAEDKG